MGASSSSAAPAASLLDRLTGREPIATGDPFWHQLLASTASLPAGSAGDDVNAISRGYCLEMGRNNARSGNFQSLALTVVDRLARATSPASSAASVLQACGGVFLVRVFLKHMLETLEPEDVVCHLRLPSPAIATDVHTGATAPRVPSVPGSAASDMADPSLIALPLAESLLRAVAECRVDDGTYALHMEALAALTVCMSAQMFCDLSAAVSLPTVTCTLSTTPPLAERVVLRLLDHYINRPPRPAPRDGRVLRTVGAVLWLPWHVYSYFFRGQERPVELADRALHVLLLLTQHLPPALFPSASPSNAFLAGLSIAGDHRVSGAASGSVVADPERGEAGGADFSVRQLHDAICSQLPSETSVVLLYLLLHGNRGFLDHALSRSDPDALLIPLLRAVSPAEQLRTSQVYMILIVILMLSQDQGLIATAHKLVLPSVPWFKDRILHQVSLGSLLVIVLVRTVQLNLTRLHDNYVQTNCLAALANMAPGFRGLHPHAARSLVSLCDVLARRYAKIEARRARATAEELREADAATGSLADISEDALCAHADFLRTALEVLNVALAGALPSNPHLVYAVLERQQVFEPLRQHALFWDLIDNIFLVVDHFGAGLHGHAGHGTDGVAGPAGMRAEAGGSGGAAGTAAEQDVWSVDNVLAHIRDASRTWRPSDLRNVPDPHFSYEEEEAPELFFTPYIWLIVREASGLSWEGARVVLVADDAGGETAAGSGESEVYDDGLPVLLAGVDVVGDVEETAVTPTRGGV